MPGLSMETRSDPCTPHSEDEDGCSDREWHPKESRGTKRRQRNRDAARKSRQKTTEMADQLHQELQHLEQDNSSLQKEISTLWREREHYSSVLEEHAPHCSLNLKRTPTMDSCTALSPGSKSVPSTVHEHVPAPFHEPVPAHVHEPFPAPVPTCVPPFVSFPPICLLSTSSLGLNPFPDMSYSVSIAGPEPSLGTPSTSRLSQNTTPQTTRCIPGPVPTHVSAPVSRLCPSTSNLHHQTTSSIPTPVPGFGHAPRFGLCTSPMGPLSSTQMSHSMLKITDRSSCVVVPVTNSSTMPSPVHRLPIVSPVSSEPLSGLALELDPDLLTTVDSSLDIAQFNDLTLVQLLEENDWILNIQ